MNRNNRTNFFVAVQMEQVDDGHAFGLTAGFRNLVALQTENPSFIGEKQQNIMGRGRQNVFDINPPRGFAYP